MTPPPETAALKDDDLANTVVLEIPPVATYYDVPRSRRKLANIRQRNKTWTLNQSNRSQR